MKSHTSPLTISSLFAAALLGPLGCTPAPVVLDIETHTSDSAGFDTSTYWVDTGSEVVVFDAQFTLEIAEDLLADIQAATSSPIRYVVVTHPNPDKFNGATVFQAVGAKVVASAATAAAMPGVHAYKEAYFTSVGMFAEGTYPPLPTVDVTFDTTLTLELDASGVDITLQVLDNPGVSSTQTVALVTDAGVGALFAGDLFANEVHAWLEGGIVDGAAHATVDGWLDALDEVTALADGTTLVYPGRGTVQTVETAVAAQKVYLETLDALVEDYVLGLEDPAAALTGSEAGTHYANITAEAEAAFPSYGLSYLITYGVYGLALQKAGVLP